MQPILNVLGILRDFEIQANLPKTQVFRGDETVQENINTFPHTLGHGNNPILTLGTPQHTHKIREVIQHLQIVFYNNYVVVILNQLPYHPGLSEPLLHV